MRLMPLVLAAALPAVAAELQLTHAPHGHVLTNVNVWSPDSRKIVYDLRAVDSVFDSTRIEQVDVATGAVELLYETKDGAACGVVTYDPVSPRVVFIHGPDHPTAEWRYGVPRRRGALVDVRRSGEARPLDAMNYAPPFTPGALRGGSHVHVFSPDGQWVSFTYEDEVLARLKEPSPDRDPNQRNVGVAVPAGPVRVARMHPRNHDGDFFSVLVTRTVGKPRPGSDEISRAFDEGWIGREGYQRADDTRQRRALAFLGTVTAPDGREHPEVFVADLPDDLTHAGDGPLEGTALRRPAPPRGVTQRRVTFTSARAFPGAVTSPRHWLRTSPDGALIAFLMKDEAGIVQLWTVPTAGGEPRQVTRNPTGITSAFTWTPDGRRIAHTYDGSVCVTNLVDGHTLRLAPSRTGADAPLPYACVVSPDGRRVAYMRNMPNGSRVFSQIFTVDLPSL